MSISTDQVFFHVVPEETDNFDRLMGSQHPRYDEQARVWSVPAELLDHSKPETKEALQAYGPNSPGEYACMVRKFREVSEPHIADVAAAVAQDVASAEPTISVTKSTNPIPALTPVEEIKRVVDPAFVAIAVNARKVGQEFLGSYGEWGLALASKGPSRDLALERLKKASPEEIRSVMHRNHMEYKPLELRENQMRFDHAVKNDPLWAARVETLQRQSGAEKGLKDAFEAFEQLGNDEKQRLGSIGLAEPVGLGPKLTGLMVALSRGSREMREEFERKSNVKMSGSHMSRVSTTVESAHVNGRLGAALAAVRGVERPRGGVDSGRGA